MRGMKIVDSRGYIYGRCDGRPYEAAGSDSEGSRVLSSRLVDSRLWLNKTRSGSVPPIGSRESMFGTVTFRVCESNWLGSNAPDPAPLHRIA